MDTERFVLIALPWVIMLFGLMVGFLLYRMPSEELTPSQKWGAFEYLVCVFHIIGFVAMAVLQVNIYEEYRNIHGVMLLVCLFLGSLVVWRAESFPTPAS